MQEDGKLSTTSSFKSSFRQSEDFIDTTITVPPDGGWGWIVVLGSFLCNFVADGAIYTFGIFLDDISRTYHTKPTVVAIGNSLMTGFYYFSGPITCALVNRLGFQVTGFLGGVIAAIAFMFSTMTTSISGFLVVFGVIGGFGFSLVYVPSVVVIGFYFERWRALATSIAVTGSAAGIIGFPMIIEGILAKCSWQTKFKVISGGCVMASCLALVYRPLRATHVLTKDKKLIQYISGDTFDSIGSFHLEEKPRLLDKLLRRFHNAMYPTASQLHKESTFVMNFPEGPSTSSVFISSVPEGSATTFMKVTPSKIDEKFDRLSTVFEDEKPKSNKFKNCLRKLCCKYKCCKWCCGSTNKNRPMYRDDIFYGGSLYTLPGYIPSRMSQTSRKKSFDYTMSVTRIEMLREGTQERVHYKCCPESVMRTLVTMLNFQLLKSPSFIFLALSGFFTLLGMYIPFIYLIERANESKLSRDVSYYLFTALGTSNALGRIISGIITTLPRAKPLLVSYVSLFICGISTIISYFATDVYSQFIYVSVFGLTIACLASLRTPIVVELLGLENLTNAFGLLLLFQGFAGFSGLPLAAQIVVITQSYNKCFIFAGCTLTLSAILLIPIKQISAWENKKKANK
ncbi:hypothetical protein MTP99_014676 [Tenebrio molitor]|nr:hypothetical protein MTP99_014676 [Tenebrio molitor]